jgi:hypothetical protein
LVVDTKLFTFAGNILLKLDELLRLVTVSSVLSMMLLKLADISLPARSALLMNEMAASVSLLASWVEWALNLVLD